MHATSMTSAFGMLSASPEIRRWVDAEDLECPGCGEPVTAEPPVEWPAGAGECPGFSHADGSVLCPDGSGRIGEPVEAAEQRYWLTEQACRALDPVRAAAGLPCCGQTVRYHGSLSERHGRYVLVGPCPCDGCMDGDGPVRWRLRSLAENSPHGPGGDARGRDDVLSHVRGSSFTVNGDGGRS